MDSPSTADRFTIEEYVRWSDVDAAGVIFYGAYVRFFEIAEGEEVDRGRALVDAQRHKLPAQGLVGEARHAAARVPDHDSLLRTELPVRDHE